MDPLSIEGAWAYTPVIRSDARGGFFELFRGSEFLAAETDEEFVDRICTLLGDEALRQRLADRARAWAQEHLRWDGSIAAYEDLYARLLNSHGS